MIYRIRVRQCLQEKRMNNKTTMTICLGLIILIQQTSFARSWTDFVKDKGMKPVDSDRISEIFDSKKQPFKDLVSHWQQKEVQEKQIEEYEKYGISKSLATRAVNERLKLAQEVINNNFDNRNISPRIDNLDNRVATMNHIAALGYERFKKLVDKYEMDISDDLYQCLCSSKGIMGTGLKYSPVPDKNCDNTNPCKGGNWGCVSTDIPKEADSWIACAKKYKLADGGNLFQKFDEHVNTSKKFNQDELARNLFERTLKFKKLCLPTMDAQNIDDIQNIFKSSITKKAIDISESSENVCDEAIAVSLYLNSEKRMTNSEAVIEGLLIFALPNTADISDFGTKKLLLEGSLKKILGKNLPIISNVMNLSSTYDLIKRGYDEEKADSQYKEAFKLFQDSKTMTREDLINYEQILKKKTDTLKNLIATSESRYIEQFELAAARVKEKIDIHMYIHKVNYDQETINALLRKFSKEQEKIKHEYENKKAEMLEQYTELSLYKKIISDYRKPLKEKGCDEFIKDRIKQCKEELIRKSRELKLEQG